MKNKNHGLIRLIPFLFLFLGTISVSSQTITSREIDSLVERTLKTFDIPEFRLYNPYVTEEFTVRDLLTHRSGLGLGAGDLVIWRGLNNFTVRDIINNQRYLKPVSGFRTKYNYDNLQYIEAVEVVARVSGMIWEDFIEIRIMQPINMTGKASGIKMKAISPLTDFSYDFQDLDFIRKENVTKVSF